MDPQRLLSTEAGGGPVIDPPVHRLISSVPLYVQIAESLMARIESGELSAGDRLPPERALSEMLGVNRLTLRRALRVLAGEGLLVRQQGRGTYIARPKIERHAGSLVSFTRGMQRSGYTPGAKIISFTQSAVDASLSKELQLSTSAPVYLIHRLRTLNREPVLLERYTVPAATFPDLDRFDLERRSLYEVFEQEYGITVQRARQSLEPVSATEYEARLLEVHAGAPLMLERRLSFDGNGIAVEHGKDLYRGDRFRFVTEIAPVEL
jgi:GntR family transcriptional regulator, N-acetylglucosamine utilization regulator